MAHTPSSGLGPAFHLHTQKSYHDKMGCLEVQGQFVNLTFTRNNVHICRPSEVANFLKLQNLLAQLAKGPLIAQNMRQ